MRVLNPHSCFDFQTFVKCGLEGHVAFLFQKDALVLATQQNIRTQTQYVQSQLADLFTADTVYGSKVVRPGSIQELSS